MATRIGVDIGGTFTDLIYYDDVSGESLVAKVPTTPDNPDEGVVTAIGQAVPADRVKAAEYFLHGTTVGINALLQRRGAVVGLLTTQGFRDILEIRRGDREEMYNLFWTPPPPLVPRRLRRPVKERVRADGEIHIAQETADVREALGVFESEDVDAIAIAYMNAYANPVHEIEAERALRAAGFEGEISVSHRVSGEYREYERTTTTVIDAFVRPRMIHYLRRLDEELAKTGFAGRLLITRSGGGSMTFAEAEERPFETIMSGPVAGAEGAGELARSLGIDNLITADVGGTSFDTCLVSGGRPQLMYEGMVVGLPVQTPWVDVRSIGAGGGSIAYIDVGGLLQVGPQSAGADPGPASYGRGGTEPTVTDCALSLGMLGEGKLASGITLDVGKARAAIEPIAAKLNFTIDQAAQGVMTIVTASMANTIREITIDQGVDPRQATLLAFGGAGPLMACALARELNIGSIVIPPYAGNFSAWGLLGADLTQAAARTRIMKLSDDALAEANDILKDLFTTLEERQGPLREGQSRSREVGLDMRYAGQEHNLTVPMEAPGGVVTASAEAVLEAFTREYERTFRNTMEEDAEIVSIRATLRLPLPRRASEYKAASADSADATEVEAYSFTEDKRQPFRIVARGSLGVGDTLEGPAIITEETATTYLDAGFEARLDASGCLFLQYLKE
ncbi:MAG: hydantoinase/oxoprolinase family protein [Rhodospirillaceae bacterium]|nr:hydantoinase/oxoprolinase family protein [Rhodospirillaceae bacterium]